MQLFKKVSDQKDNNQDTSKNTKFAKQPNMEILPKFGKTNALSKPVPSNSVSTPPVSKGVNNAKVDTVSREAKKVPNTDVISKVVCVVCKKCLNSVNHDVCLNDCVNGKKSRGRKHKEVAKFVGDFKSLANEADASLAKHKALELEIKRLLKAVVSHDIMNIVQKESVVDTSDLQTELERIKERFENSYKDMQQKIEQLQAQLEDLKGKSKDTSCVSDTRNLLSRKLMNENVELEFQVLIYARENAHLKATYKKLFDSISVSRAQTKTIIASLQNELQSNIYKNAKLRTQLFKKVSDQKDNTQDTSENTKFAKQPIVENLSKVGKTNALSNPVTSNSVSTPLESKSVNNDKVIAPRMFRINPSKTSREEKHVPNTVSASARIKPITVSQPHVITKKYVNSDLNGLSSTRVDNTKTRRPQPMSNSKNDRVPSASKSSRSQNKEAKVEEHHRNLLLSKNNKHISSACNNIKIDSQDKLENENVELEFQVFNYARENAHLKATYKNLFDSIFVSRAQTETKIASLQNELQSNIYKNAKLRMQLFKKVSDQKDNTQDMSKNTKFAKQPIAEILSRIGETNALSKSVTSNSVSTPKVSKGVNNAKVIALGMFRISPDKVSREAKKVPNTVSASSRTKPITVSQPNVITKKNMNSDLNGLSSTGLDNTKTRRPQPRSNTKNDRVPSVSKSSRSKNKDVKVEEHHRNLLLSKKNKHISSACNNSKTDSQDVISKVVCVVCKQCLNSVNHDVCLHTCVNGKKSRGRKHKVNISKNETQQKNQQEIKKPKKVGFIKRLATPKPRKPRFLLRWSPTGKMFDQYGKLVVPSNSESHVDCSNGDNACTSNEMEPKIKRFPNSTSLLG
nr:hypothetical protein [Tanacetum cinerariifolium]